MGSYAPFKMILFCFNHKSHSVTPDRYQILLVWKWEALHNKTTIKPCVCRDLTQCDMTGQQSFIDGLPDTPTTASKEVSYITMSDYLAGPTVSLDWEVACPLSIRSSNEAKSDWGDVGLHAKPIHPTVLHWCKHQQVVQNLLRTCFHIKGSFVWIIYSQM